MPAAVASPEHRARAVALVVAWPGVNPIAQGHAFAQKATGSARMQENLFSTQDLLSNEACRKATPDVTLTRECPPSQDV